jgi:hypothetical protein
METASNAPEIFLTRLDPARALKRAVDDFKRLSQLDPKLGVAKEMLQERFALLPGESYETLGAALWAYSRTPAKRNEFNGFRAWLDDGDLVLRTAEDALGSIFSLPVLKEVIQYGTEITATDGGPATTEFQHARVEIQRFLSTHFVAAAVLALAGVGIAALYLIYVEGYTLTPPPPPPPTNRNNQ